MYMLYGFCDKARGKYLPTVRIRDRLSEMRKNVQTAGEDEYKRLLVKTVTSLVDDITLGRCKRPGKISLLEAARQMLDERINSAMRRNTPTEYNMQVLVKVLISEDQSVYYNILAQNRVLQNAAFSDGLKPCHVKNNESPDTEVWEKLQNAEKEYPSMTVQLFPCGNVKVDGDKLVFPKVMERAQIIARHRMQNVLLSAYASDPNNIPPEKLMEYMDEALTAFSSDRVKSEYNTYVSQLLGILQNITMSYIQADPSAASEKQSDSNGDAVENDYKFSAGGEESMDSANRDNPHEN